MSSTPETPTLKLMHKPRGRHDCSLVNTYFYSFFEVFSATHALSLRVFAFMPICIPDCSFWIRMMEALRILTSPI